MYSVSNFCIVMQLKVQIHVKVCCKDIQKIDFPSKKKKKNWKQLSSVDFAFWQTNLSITNLTLHPKLFMFLYT